MTASCCVCVWGHLGEQSTEALLGMNPNNTPRMWVSSSDPFNRRETEASVAPAQPPEGRGPCPCPLPAGRPLGSSGGAEGPRMHLASFELPWDPSLSPPERIQGPPGAFAL